MVSEFRVLILRSKCVDFYNSGKPSHQTASPPGRSGDTCDTCPAHLCEGPRWARSVSFLTQMFILQYIVEHDKVWVC